MASGSTSEGLSTLQTALVTAVTNVFANMQSASNDSGPSSSKSSTTRARSRVTRDSSDDDDFEQCTKRFRKALPSKFSRRVKNVSGPIGKKRIYERDIILLPSHFANEDNGRKCIRIPRGEVREYLSSNNLLGKITLDSTMTQQDIFDDIREIFQKPMKNKADFDFTVLQPTGGGSKTLSVPCHSKNFEWSATSIVSKSTKTPIYLLANEDIKECTPKPEEQSQIRGASGTSGSSPIYIPDDNDLSVPNPPSPKLPSPLVPTYYSSYVDLVLDDENSDNSQLPSPVQPSFSPITPSDSQEDMSLHLLLQSHQSKVIRPDQTHRITVRRSHIVSDAILAVRKGFDMSISIRVTFIGEPAVDAGGPLREFFRLVLRGLVTDNSLFQGPDDCRSPAHNTIELRKGTFKIIGELFALSIVHGGPGPQCLSHAVVDYFAYGIHKVHGTIEDVHDPFVREKIKKLVDAEDTEFVDLLMSDEYDFVYSCGVAVPSSGVLKVKDQIIEGIISHYAVMLIKAELDEVAIGMEKLGVLSLLQKNPVKMRSIFIAYQFHLSADVMQDLFRIHFSPVGSNSRQKEEEVSLYWVNFLQDIEGSNGLVKTESSEYNITLGDVLAFITGASSIPPMGFTNKPSIQFHSISKYAEANTCGNVLRLSMLTDSYEEFRDLFCFSIANSIGFGKV